MPWLPCTYVHEGRSRCARTPSCEGPQAPYRVSSILDVIKSSADISLIFNKGKRIGTPDITLIVMRNEKQHGQYGRAAFVAGKKQGNAVWRNRAKRRMRAVYRETCSLFNGFDVVFLAKKSINNVPYSILVQNIDKAMKKRA